MNVTDLMEAATGDAERSDSATGLDDDVLGALADERRRWVLATLVKTDGPVSMETLAASTDTLGTDDVLDEWDEPAIDLHHVHLPKLADAGLVRYDVDARTVETTATGEAVGLRLSA